jgi:acetolactate synthase-1/2/3 large subunit
MGRPEATCVALVGDGAFMMHGAEVSTAQAHDVGAIWIVLRDDDLHMVSQGMTYGDPDPTDPDVWMHLYRLGTPDLVAFASGLGADAYAVESPAELRSVWPAVLDGANVRNKPQVLVARINQRSLNPYFPPRSPASPSGSTPGPKGN